MLIPSLKTGNRPGTVSTQIHVFLPTHCPACTCVDHGLSSVRPSWPLLDSEFVLRKFVFGPGDTLILRSKVCIALKRQEAHGAAIRPDSGTDSSTVSTVLTHCHCSNIRCLGCRVCLHEVNKHMGDQVNKPLKNHLTNVFPVAECNRQKIIYKHIVTCVGRKQFSVGLKTSSVSLRLGLKRQSSQFRKLD